MSRITCSFAMTTYIVNTDNLDALSPSQDIVETVDNIPTLDQCWLQCLSVLCSFADSSFYLGDDVCKQ